MEEGEEEKGSGSSSILVLDDPHNAEALYKVKKIKDKFFMEVLDDFDWRY